MKRVIIVFLILLVIGTVGFYTYNEFHVREIMYVGDYESESFGNTHSVRRLYSSDVDFEKYNQKLEDLISLEFTEEEILKAALESGEPEFYPAFHTGVYKANANDDFFVLSTKVIQQLAENQTRANFTLSNLRLEVISNNVTIDEIAAESQDNLSVVRKEVPIINEERTGMTVDLRNYGDTSITFNGTTGMIVLQYVFDIESVSLFPKTVMTDCFIRINVSVSEDADGRIAAEYSVDNASTVEEYIDGDAIEENIEPESEETVETTVADNDVPVEEAEPTE